MSETSMVERAPIGKLESKVEQEPTVNPSAFVKSADATWLRRFKNLISEKARKISELSIKTVKKGAKETVLTGAALSYLISSGCGNIENPNAHAPNIIEPTAVSAPKTSPTNAAEENVVSEDTKKTVKDIETRFQVDLITPDELPEVEIARIKRPLDEPAVILLPFPELMNKKFPVAEWNKDDTEKLKRILNELPSHFYLPSPPKTVELNFPNTEVEKDKIKFPMVEWSKDKFHQLFLDWARYNLNDESFFISQEDLVDALEKGSLEIAIDSRPVQFILADTASANERLRRDLGGTCNCHDMMSGHQVIFQENKFENEDFDSSFSIAAHELTHRIIHPDREDFYASFVANVLKITDWNQYQRVVGEKAAAVGDRLSEKEKDRLKYAQRSWGEFIPVATEFYIKGQEEFSKVYVPFVGEPEAGKLYEFMKDEVFLGKEYNYRR